MNSFDEVPLSAFEFGRLLDAVGPFDASPCVAVATSGGADSVALCLLMHQWAEDRNGKCHALVVDHGLRSDSAREAVQVADWLVCSGIDTHVLTWSGHKPVRGIQAAAREARYDLLLSWCRDHGISDLFLAHHRDDQAETFLMRLGRKSGVDGLSAMAAVSHRGDVRVVRPLLNVPKSRLIATLKNLGHPWVEDPSNHDPAFARSRVRELVPALAVIGITAEGIAVTARRLGRARAALEHYASELVRSGVESHSAGFCWIDREALLAAPAEVGLRVLSRVVAAVGTGRVPPRFDRLERMYATLFRDGHGRGCTLSGCRIITRGHRFLVCRENRGIGDCVTLQPGQNRRWDARFNVSLRGSPSLASDQTCEVRRLGPEGWPQVAARSELRLHERHSGIPAAVRATLPALWDQVGLLDVPHLNFRRDGAQMALDVKFAPTHPLVYPPFSVVSVDTPPI